MVGRGYGYSRSLAKQPLGQGLKLATLVGCGWGLILTILVTLLQAQTVYLVPLLQTGWIIVSLVGGYGAGLNADRMGWFYGSLTGLLIGLLCGSVVLLAVPGWVSLSVFISMNLMSLCIGLLGGSMGINHKEWLRQHGRRFM